MLFEMMSIYGLIRMANNQTLPCDFHVWACVCVADRAGTNWYYFNCPSTMKKESNMFIMQVMILAQCEVQIASQLIV